MTELILTQTKKALAQEIRITYSKIAELKEMLIIEEMNASLMEEEYNNLLQNGEQ